MDVFELTDANFDETVAKPGLLVIDFWAEWCEPCKAFSRTFAEAAVKYPEVLFASVNIEKEGQLAIDFDVHSVPKLIIMRDGVVVCDQSGVMPLSAIDDLISQAKQTGAC